MGLLFELFHVGSERRMRETGMRGFNKTDMVVETRHGISGGTDLHVGHAALRHNARRSAYMSADHDKSTVWRLSVMCFWCLMFSLFSKHTTT